jgi:hypothetical protein
MVRYGSSTDVLLTVALFVVVVLACVIFYVPVAIGMVLLGGRVG